MVLGVDLDVRDPGHAARPRRARIRRVARQGAQKAEENCSSVARSPEPRRRTRVPASTSRARVSTGSPAGGRSATPRTWWVPRNRPSDRSAAGAERRAPARRPRRSTTRLRCSRRSPTGARARAFRPPRLSRRRTAAGTPPSRRARPGRRPGRAVATGRSPTQHRAARRAPAQPSRSGAAVEHALDDVGQGDRAVDGDPRRPRRPGRGTRGGPVADRDHRLASHLRAESASTVVMSRYPSVSAAPSAAEEPP